MMKGNVEDGEVKLGPDEHLPDDAEEMGHILVLASGNLGLVYSTRQERRVTMEEIETGFPGLLDGLVQHEGIGWVMVHSAEHGPVVIGARGRAYLDASRVEGEDPLAAFGARAADHLRRYDAFPDAPDIYVNSFYHAETNEVAAFEELIGCHGGMGGYQTRPFLLYPAEWTLDETPLVGAAAVHRQLKQWLNNGLNNGQTI
jgi:hypothetical protein